MDMIADALIRRIDELQAKMAEIESVEGWCDEPADCRRWFDLGHRMREARYIFAVTLAEHIRAEDTVLNPKVQS